MPHNMHKQLSIFLLGLILILFLGCNKNTSKENPVEVIANRNPYLNQVIFEKLKVKSDKYNDYFIYESTNQLIIPVRSKYARAVDINRND